MANRKATFAKRQRETDLKDRAKQKEDRRSQKRGEVRDSKGPQIAWDEAVHAVTSDELPSLGTANQGSRNGDGQPGDDAGEGGEEGAGGSAEGAAVGAAVGAAGGSTGAPVTPAPSAKQAAAAPKPGPAATKPATAPNPAVPRPVG